MFSYFEALELTRQNVFVHKNRASLQSNSLEILYKKLKDQCEEVNVNLIEEKVSWKDHVRVDFHQVLLSKVLYEDCMIFLPECGADKSLFVFQHRAGFFPPQVDA